MSTFGLLRYFELHFCSGLMYSFVPTPIVWEWSPCLLPGSCAERQQSEYFSTRQVTYFVIQLQWPNRSLPLLEHDFLPRICLQVLGLCVQAPSHEYMRPHPTSEDNNYHNVHFPCKHSNMYLLKEIHNHLSFTIVSGIFQPLLKCVIAQLCLDEQGSQPSCYWLLESKNGEVHKLAHLFKHSQDLHRFTTVKNNQRVRFNTFTVVDLLCRTHIVPSMVLRYSTAWTGMNPTGRRLFLWVFWGCTAMRRLVCTWTWNTKKNPT